MGTSDFDRLAEKFGETPATARHLIECDDCHVIGDEWQQYTCTDYALITGRLYYTCKTLEQHEWDQRIKALWGPTIDAALSSMPTFGDMTFSPVEKRPGETVEFRMIRDE